MAEARPPREGHAQSRFALLALPHLDAAYNLARWLVGDATAAEDVVQTAIARALDRSATFRGENARDWLLQSVRITAETWLAECRRGPASLEDEIEQRYEETADPADDPEEALARSQDRRRLARMLAKLPPQLRACIVLREIEDMDYKEIAAVTGVPIGTVMSRLWRARRLLAREAKREGIAGRYHRISQRDASLRMGSALPRLKCS